MTSGASYQPQRSKRSPRGRTAGGVRRLVHFPWRLTSIVQLIGGRYANLLLFAVTLVELNVLIWTTTTFAVEDWIYLSQHILVLAIAVTRRRPVVQDRSWSAALAVAVSYAYPYAQVFYLNSTDGYVAWPAGGVTLVIFSALLSLSALLSIGRLFGVRPALRGITRNGPYRLVRHPMYLAYFIADIGYLLEEWNIGAVLIAAAGWVSLVYRIYAEERMLSRHSDWAAYVARTRYRLVPGLW